tara:strand:+ start:7250 stop:8044 length:795 start_codon:yes stop_codon:yes gene_type:complete
LKNIGVILFDIDGVIRNVAKSYRLAVQKTVYKFIGWEPSPINIDDLKNEGIWNNDWDLSLELIKRYISQKRLNTKPPSRKEIINLFEELYFGCKSSEDYSKWDGFIRNEELLVNREFFEDLSLKGLNWGFVSGAEPESAKFVLENKLNLNNPPLIAMNDAPDKPNPQGFISLARKLTEGKLGAAAPPVAYVGDTIADVKTVLNARQKISNQKFICIGIAPPHLHAQSLIKKRIEYETNLKNEGADFILNKITDINEVYNDIFVK